MDWRIDESRNRSSQKGRTIGESLKEVIFPSHASLPKTIGFYTETTLTTANLIVKFIISIEQIGFPGICDIALPGISRSCTRFFEFLARSLARPHPRAIRRPRVLCYSELPPYVSEYG